VVVPGRLADVTDLLANTLGGWAGVITWRGLRLPNPAN
jgi:glycopeptide antibiotics resistance protein